MDMWVYHTHSMIDEYKKYDANVVLELYIKPMFVKGDYLAIYGALQYLIRHKVLSSQV